MSLEELRTRSYPSFTRIVIETTAPVVHKVESTGPKEARVRLVGLAGEAQVESIDDGLVDDARLERAGADALLRVVFEGGAAELRVTTLADPPRLVLDFNRPQEVAARERQACTSLRTLVLDAGHGGHDSGAIGPTGLMEKELVLDVTKRVARLVEEKLGVKVATHPRRATSSSRCAIAPATPTASGPISSSRSTPMRIRVVGLGRGGDLLPVVGGDRQRLAPGGRARERRGPAREAPAGAGRKPDDVLKTILWDLAQSEFQWESLAAGRDRAGLDDPVAQPRRIAASSRPASTCWAAPRCPPS